MELRNTRTRRQRDAMDSKDLEMTIRGLGYYEEGMEVQEMRQIINALQESIRTEDFVWTECDVTQRMQDCECPIRAENVCNSTMLNASSNLDSAEHRSWQRRASQTLLDSPSTPAQQVTVHAEIHHTLDWSPPARTNPTLHILNALNSLTTPKIRERDRDAIKINTTITQHTSRDSQHSSYCADSESNNLSSCVDTTQTDSGVSVNTDSDSFSLQQFNSNSASSECFSWHAHAQASTSSVAVSDSSAASEERNNSSHNERDEYEQSTEF